MVEFDPASIKPDPDALKVLEFINRSDATIYKAAVSPDKRWDKPWHIKDADALPGVVSEEPYKGGLAELVYAAEKLAQTLPEETKDLSVTLDRLAGIAAVAQMVAGKDIDPNVYTRATMGADLERVPDERIQSWKAELHELMLEAKFPHGYSSDSLEQYRAGALAAKESVIRQHYLEEESETAERLWDSTGIELARPELIPVWSDEPIAGYFTVEKGKFLTKINYNDKLYRHTVARLADLGAEESIHATQMYCWLQAISRNAINASLAITTLVSEEITQFEAVPPIVRRLVMTPERSIMHVIEARIIELKNMVYQNALYDAAYDTKVTSKIQEDTKELLPLTEPALVENVVIVLRDHPLYRAAFATYWPAQKIADTILSIKNERLQNQALRELIKQPARPQQLQARAEELVIASQM